jgi:hypothetical protein
MTLICTQTQNPKPLVCTVKTCTITIPKYVFPHQKLVGSKVATPAAPIRPGTQTEPKTPFCTAKTLHSNGQNPSPAACQQQCSHSRCACPIAASWALEVEQSQQCHWLGQGWLLLLLLLLLVLHPQQQQQQCHLRVMTVGFFCQVRGWGLGYGLGLG